MAACCPQCLPWMPHPLPAALSVGDEEAEEAAEAEEAPAPAKKDKKKEKKKAVAEADSLFALLGGEGALCCAAAGAAGSTA